MKASPIGENISHNAFFFNPAHTIQHIHASTLVDMIHVSNDPCHQAKPKWTPLLQK